MRQRVCEVEVECEGRVAALQREVGRLRQELDAVRGDLQVYAGDLTEFFYFSYYYY